jgi:hypothetical protein
MRNKLKMNKIKRSQQGFTAVELVILLIFLAIIIVLGVHVAYLHRTSKPVVATNNSTSVGSTAVPTPIITNPYVGWSTYTLKYENASFEFPDDLKLSDASNTGSDVVQLNGPSFFVMYINTGSIGYPGFSNPTPVLTAIPVTFVGQKGYLDYTSTSNDGLVEEVSLSKSSTNFLDAFPSKASGTNESAGGNFQIEAREDNPYTAVPGLTVAQAKLNPSYNDVKLLVQSIKYEMVSPTPESTSALFPN